MIKLYGVPGSRAMRCLWMLEEVGVPYENIKTMFGTDSRSAEYLKINPNGHVPALVDDDVTLWESLAINLYLARKYGKDLWPESIGAEGHTYKWTLWALTEAEEPVVTALMHRAIFPESQRDAAKGDAAAERAKVPLAVLDGQLAGREFLVNDRFTVADLNVASVVGWVTVAGIDLGPFPQVGAWLGRCSQRPAYGRAMSLM